MYILLREWYTVVTRVVFVFSVTFIVDPDISYEYVDETIVSEETKNVREKLKLRRNLFLSSRPPP
jgi:hypothetical protein